MSLMVFLLSVGGCSNPPAIPRETTTEALSKDGVQQQPIPQDPTTKSPLPTPTSTATSTSTPSPKASPKTPIPIYKKADTPVFSSATKTQLRTYGSIVCHRNYEAEMTCNQLDDLKQCLTDEWNILCKRGTPRLVLCEDPKKITDHKLCEPQIRHGALHPLKTIGGLDTSTNLLCREPKKAIFDLPDDNGGPVPVGFYTIGHFACEPNPLPVATTVSCTHFVSGTSKNAGLPSQCIEAGGFDATTVASFKNFCETEHPDYRFAESPCLQDQENLVIGCRKHSADKKKHQGVFDYKAHTFFDDGPMNSWWTYYFREQEKRCLDDEAGVFYPTWYNRSKVFSEWFSGEGDMFFP